MPKSISFILIAKALFIAAIMTAIAYFLCSVAMRDSKITKLSKDPLKRAQVISENLDYLYRRFKPGTPRQEVIKMIPPMNDDSQEIAVWLSAGHGETVADVTGKSWNKLIFYGDGYYIRFDKEGKVVGWISSLSASPLYEQGTNPPLPSDPNPLD